MIDTEIKPIHEGFLKYLKGLTDQQVASSLRSTYSCVEAYKKELRDRGYALTSKSSGKGTDDRPLATIQSINISKTETKVIEL